MVVFDLDGVLIDSESTWDDARRQVTSASGGRWTESATRDMMGMSSVEWSHYLRDRLGVKGDPLSISVAVEARVLVALGAGVPWIDGAREAVERVARDHPVAIASSANRSVIDLVVERGGLERAISATVSSEEVARGKPAPDVYLEAARRLGADPATGVAIEDSTNGLRSAWRAGFAVVALPNRRFPPDPGAVRLAVEVISSLDQLTSGLLAAALRSGRPSGGATDGPCERPPVANGD
jgi:HAD superfamily hydrolase (TIGR01509 family)